MPIGYAFNILRLIMHESSIVQSILKTVCDKGAEMQVRAITKVTIVVGEDTGFMGDSIQFYFDRHSAYTIAAGAKLEIRFVKAQLKCPACGKMFERKRFEFACPECGTDGIPSEIGKECYIENIEIEEAEES